MYTKYKIVPFCPYHFVRTILSNTILSVYHFVHTILSVPFCPLPFCPVTNTCHSCKTQVQRDRYINNKEKLKSASLVSLAFSNLKNILNFIINLDFVSSFLDLVKTLSLFLTLKVSVASAKQNFSKLKLINNHNLAINFSLL